MIVEDPGLAGCGAMWVGDFFRRFEATHRCDLHGYGESEESQN